MLKEKLTEARKAAGKTQKEVADYIGVQPSTYSCYESGKREPDGAKLRKIARFLNVSGDYLLGIETEPDEVFEVEVAQADAKMLLFDDDEVKLVTYFHQLNTAGRAAALASLKSMAATPELR